MNPGFTIPRFRLPGFVSSVFQALVTLGWAQVEEDATGLVDEQRSAHLLEGTGGRRLAECNGLGSDSHGGYSLISVLAHSSRWTK